MSEHRIQTLGPADPNAGTRAKVWAGLAVLTPLLAALATFGILSDDQANALNGAITAALGLLSAFGFSFVAKKTNEQVKNGTFDQAPAAAPARPPISLQDVADVRNELDSVITGAVATAQVGLNQLTSIIPGGAAVTNVVMSGPVGDLIQAVLDRSEKQ